MKINLEGTAEEFASLVVSLQGQKLDGLLEQVAMTLRRVSEQEKRHFSAGEYGIS